MSPQNHVIPPVLEQGIATQDLDALAFATRLQRSADAHKGDAGTVVVMGGAHGMSGGLLLAGLGALYSGAGLITLGMRDHHSAQVNPNHPELMIHDVSHQDPDTWLHTHQPDVLAIGPGLGQDKPAKSWLMAALSHSGPLIIDADALNIVATHRTLLSKIKQRASPTILTPHPGEAGRLLHCEARAIQDNRLAALGHLIALTEAIVVLKGQHSLVGAPDCIPQRCLAGNPGMASGGMGDVLTGIISALCAQGMHHELDAWQATCLAVELHATAGDHLLQQKIGPVGMTASELALAARWILNEAMYSSSHHPQQ